MEHVAVFQEQVALTPKDMRQQIDSIDELLLLKLKQRLEGRCSRNGFVVPGTVKILSRSMGVVEKGRFTGSVLFYLHAEGQVLNPPDGAIVEGEVVRKNKMGMYVSYQVNTGDGMIDAIKIILPRDLPEHMTNEAFNAVEIGERVSVEIKKSRFQVNDPNILSVGVFQGKAKGVGKKREMPRALEPAEVFDMETGADLSEPEEGAEETEGEEETEAEDA